MGRVVQWQLFIKWNPSGSYVDESQHLLSADGEMSFVPAEDAMMSSGRGVVDTCTLLLRNKSGRFSPLNTAGPLYSYIQDGKAYRAPLYLSVSVDGGGGYSRVFTGITKIPEEQGPTWNEGPTVKLECRSLDELALQKRVSTALGNFQYQHNQGYTEAQLINAWLDAGNLTATRNIDNGVISIPWAWLDDESILEDCWQLAAACGGRFYTDPDGVSRYENFYHWTTAPHTTSQETLTPSDYQSLTPVYSDKDLYDTVTVEYSSRQIGTADKLWTPDDPISVPPNSTKKITARLRQPAYTIDTPQVKATGAAGDDLTPYVSVSCTYYAQRVDITLSNTHATRTAFIATLRLTGRPLVGGPTQETTRTAAADGYNGSYWTGQRGNRTKSVRGNVYVQSEAQADMMARFLLHRLERPRLTFKLGGCLGKPGRRLGDRITINDPNVMSSGRDAFLTAVKWKLNGSGFVQDLEAVDATQLHPYGSYFVIGTNKLGASGGSLTAPIYY